MIGLSLVFALLLMGGLWLIYCFQHKANIVDIGWVASLLIAMSVCLFLGYSYEPRLWLLILMGAIWGVRLLVMLGRRYVREEEDARYGDLRVKWGGDADKTLFLMMFLFQGILAVLLALPFFLVAADPNPFWSTAQAIGGVLWLIGFVGVAYADYQLAQFKADPQHTGVVCNTGLWRFSRHPNYFFESIVWFGFAVYAWSAPFGMLALLSPLLILYLLLFVSGIPLAEARALKTRGEAYKAYQESTSAFIPWI